MFHHLINKSLFALPIKGSRQHIEIHVPDQIQMPIEQREILTNKRRQRREQENLIKLPAIDFS